ASRVLLPAGIVTLLIINRRLQQPIAGVPPVALTESTCVQPASTDDFSAYWNQFQTAVRTRDKPKLFAMINTCGFYWDVFYENEGLRKPLPNLACAPDQHPPLF